jgi:membrane protein
MEPALQSSTEHPCPRSSPWRFSWREWRALLARTWRQTLADDIDLMAAGVAFYGFLALVPMLGALVLSYGLLATPDSVLGDFRKLTEVMPAEAARLVRHELLTIVTESGSKKGLGLALALALALFGVRSGAGAIITALNLAYEERETRGFVHLNLIAVAVTVTGILIALFGTAAVAMLAGLEHLLMPSVPPALRMVEKVAAWLAVVMVGGAIAAALYWIGPDRPLTGLIWLTPGAVLASVGWMVVTLAFGSYVASFGNYNATYGSLSAVVVVLTWFYLSSFILLLGAELNSECERQGNLLKPDDPAPAAAPSPAPGADSALDRKQAEHAAVPAPVTPACDRGPGQSNRNLPCAGTNRRTEYWTK